MTDLSGPEIPHIPLTTKDKLIFAAGATVAFGPLAYYYAREWTKVIRRKLEGRER